MPAFYFPLVLQRRLIHVGEDRQLAPLFPGGAGQAAVGAVIVEDQVKMIGIACPCPDFLFRETFCL